MTPSITVSPSLTPTKTPSVTPSQTPAPANATLTFTSYQCTSAGKIASNYGLFTFTLSAALNQDITVTSAQVLGYDTLANCNANSSTDGPDIMGVSAGGDATDAYMPSGTTVGYGTGITGNQLNPSAGTTYYKRQSPIQVKIGSGTPFNVSNNGTFTVGPTTVTVVISSACTTYSNCPPPASVTPTPTPTPSPYVAPPR